MNCLPLWVLKCCVQVLALIYTQTPLEVPTGTLAIDAVSSQNSSLMAHHMLALPTEVKQRILWDLIRDTANTIAELKKRTAYVLSMRTINTVTKKSYDSLAVGAMLDLWGKEAGMAYKTIFITCPVPIAQEIISRLGLVNINQEYRKPLSTNDREASRHTTLLQEACIANDDLLVKRLLELGADQNVRNTWGRTVHDYVKSNQTKIAGLLAHYKKTD